MNLPTYTHSQCSRSHTSKQPCIWNPLRNASGNLRASEAPHVPGHGIHVMPADTELELDDPTDWPIVETDLRKRLRTESLIEALDRVKIFVIDACTTAFEPVDDPTTVFVSV